MYACFFRTHVEILKLLLFCELTNHVTTLLKFYPEIGVKFIPIYRSSISIIHFSFSLFQLQSMFPQGFCCCFSSLQIYPFSQVNSSQLDTRFQAPVYPLKVFFPFLDIHVSLLTFALLYSLAFKSDNNQKSHVNHVTCHHCIIFHRMFTLPPLCVNAAI